VPRTRPESVEHHLTAEGERVHRAGHEVADSVLRECFAGLAEPERETLLRVLPKIGDTWPEAGTG
jgi:DNA-binding MarR family transcriptional regulator